MILWKFSESMKFIPLMASNVNEIQSEVESNIGNIQHVVGWKCCVMLDIDKMNMSEYF